MQARRRETGSGLFRHCLSFAKIKRIIEILKFMRMYFRGFGVKYVCFKTIVTVMRCVLIVIIIIM